MWYPQQGILWKVIKVHLFLWPCAKSLGLGLLAQMLTNIRRAFRAWESMWRMQLQPFTPGKCFIHQTSMQCIWWLIPSFDPKGVRQILFHSFRVSTWAASFRPLHLKMKISWKEFYFVSLSFQCAFSKERNELLYVDHEKYTKCLLCAYVCVGSYRGLNSKWICMQH